MMKMKVVKNNMSILKENDINKKNKSKSLLDESNIIERKPLKEQKKVINSIAEIYPVVDFADYDFFEMRNGEYMEIVQVTSKDIYSLNEENKDNDIFSLAYLFQAYIHDIKIVPLHTPVVLEKQKDQITKNIRNCKKEEYIPFLEKKLSELEFIEENRTNKEYFFFIYGDTPQSLLERRSHMKNLLVDSNTMIQLDIEKKINVLFQLSNLNTKPIAD